MGGSQSASTFFARRGGCAAARASRSGWTWVAREAQTLTRRGGREDATGAARRHGRKGWPFNGAAPPRQGGGMAGEEGDTGAKRTEHASGDGERRGVTQRRRVARWKGGPPPGRKSRERPASGRGRRLRAGRLGQAGNAKGARPPKHGAVALLSPQHREESAGPHRRPGASVQQRSLRASPVACQARRGRSPGDS